MTTPEKVSLEELCVKLPQKIDIFICSASYEERCLSAALNIGAHQVDVSLVCVNEEFLGDVSQNQKILMDHFGAHSREVRFRQDNPVKAMDALHFVLHPVLTDSSKNIVVDATTFTHEGLLILLKFLSAVARPIDNIGLVYTPASEYAVGLAPNEKWLSKGVSDIRSVLGYPGLISPTRKMHLVVLVGFEVERARLLIDLSDPDVLSLGQSYDATDDARSHLSINVATLNQLGIHYPNFNEFTFSSIDCSATAISLRKHIDKFPQRNTVIAPMNTKISTIGAGIYALSHTNVQLCYAPAVTYNTHGYSKPDNYILYLPHLFAHTPDSRN